ncbi:MAG: fibronectin type III domain-containing protein, partial [Cytophagaceae bacterium]
MKKILLLASTCLLSLSMAYSQTVNQSKTGWRTDFAHGNGENRPCWTSAAANEEAPQYYNLSETAEGTFRIQGMSANPEYDGVWMGITQQCRADEEPGGGQVPIDVTNSPTVRFRVRSNTAGTVVSIQMGDNQNRSTNCNACGNTLTISAANVNNWVEQTFNYTGKFVCQYGSCSEPTAVDPANIDFLYITINPGTANNPESLVVEFDYIIVGNDEITIDPLIAGNNTGYSNEFYYTEGTEPCWTSPSEDLNGFSHQAEDGTWTITGDGTAPAMWTSGIWMGIVPNCVNTNNESEIQASLDLSNNPFVQVFARSSVDGTALTIGGSTFILSEVGTLYTGEFIPSDEEDINSISDLTIFVDGEDGGFDGTVEIDWILLGSAVELPTPDVPTGLVAEAISYRQIEVSWESVIFATSYVVEYSEDGENWESLETNETTVIIEGLDFETTYSIRVSAKNNGGTSEPSEVVTETTLEAPDVPAQPAVSAPSNITETSVTLNWEAAARATSYRIERNDNGSWVEVDVIEEITYAVSGLTPNTNYEFRIVAVNVSG